MKLNDERPLVLIVEDDDRLAKTLCKLVRQLGYNAVAIEGSQIAEHLASHDEPDLIITDIFMPGVDGLEVIMGLKKSDFRDIPIIAISGGGTLFRPGLKAGDTFYTKAAKDFGAVEFLSKPIDRATLKSAIDRHVH